jgi:hypothetical protein
MCRQYANGDVDDSAYARLFDQTVISDELLTDLTDLVCAPDCYALPDGQHADDCAYATD